MRIMRRCLWFSIRHLGGGNLEVFSAGAAPSAIHPYAIRALADLGIDISQQYAKSVDEFAGQTFDHVITVCDRARENCPVFPGVSQLIHWSFPDPAVIAEKKLQYQAFQQTAQQLEVRIRFLLARINSPNEVAS
jgi:protein-tyrosine-phosphatase